MTINDYNTATELLADIEKLEDQLQRVQLGIRVVAEAEGVGQFTDLSQLQTDIEVEIQSQIDAKQTTFDNL